MVVPVLDREGGKGCEQRYVDDGEMSDKTF